MAPADVVADKLSVEPAHIGLLLVAFMFGLGFMVMVILLLLADCGIAHGLLLVNTQDITLPVASVEEEYELLVAPGMLVAPTLHW